MWYGYIRLESETPAKERERFVVIIFFFFSESYFYPSEQDKKWDISKKFVTTNICLQGSSGCYFDKSGIGQIINRVNEFIFNFECGKNTNTYARRTRRAIISIDAIGGETERKTLKRNECINEICALRCVWFYLNLIADRYSLDIPHILCSNMYTLEQKEKK